MGGNVYLKLNICLGAVISMEYIVRSIRRWGLDIGSKGPKKRMSTVYGHCIDATNILMLRIIMLCWNAVLRQAIHLHSFV